MSKINTTPNAWDLRYFQEIALTLNLSRAAERLGVGQSALSLALKRLEQSLGANLFYRRSRGLILTSAGQRLLKESNHLLATWEALLSQTKKSQVEMTGRFSIGCHPSVAIYSVGPILKDLYSKHPGIEIKLVHGLSRVMCEQVISGEIDFGIVINPIRHPDLVIHKLATDQVAFWSTQFCIEDVLICNPDLAQTQSLLKKLTPKNFFKRMITSESLEVITRLAEDGVGTAILPSRVAELSSKKLHKHSELPSYHDKVDFIYRSDLTRTVSATYIVNLIRNLKI